MPYDEEKLADINRSVRSLSSDLAKLRARDEGNSGQLLGQTEEHAHLVLSPQEWLRTCKDLEHWSLPSPVEPPADFSSDESGQDSEPGPDGEILQDELEDLLSSHHAPVLTRQSLFSEPRYPSAFNRLTFPKPKAPPRFNDAPPKPEAFLRPETPPSQEDTEISSLPEEIELPKPPAATEASSPGATIWPSNPILFLACIITFPAILLAGSRLDTSHWSLEATAALAWATTLSAILLCVSFIKTWNNREFNRAAFDRALAEESRILEERSRKAEERSRKAEERRQEAQEKFREAEERFRKAKRRHEKALKLYRARVQQYEEITASLASAMSEAEEFWLAGEKTFMASVVGSNRYVEDLFSDLDNARFSRLPELVRIADRLTRRPAAFPSSNEVRYDPLSKIVIINKAIPNLKELPLRAKDRNGSPKAVTKTDLMRLQKSVPCSIALLTANVVFSIDYPDAIEAVCFNGTMSHIDPRDGHRKDAVVLSALLKREDIAGIRFESVDPVAAITALRGRQSADFGTAAPVAPILSLDTSDSRLVESSFDLDLLNQQTNLAEMRWEDFESLVREVFAHEFSGDGMEIHVTQSSRDGGVDAIAWDSDPIRGGKFVFQAKRYTNVVGVSAVRDLFGVVIHEGATRGILVTTSSFGPDAYKFAEKKPLTLIDGDQLLGLLEKHGYSVRIDLDEARGRV